MLIKDVDLHVLYSVCTLQADASDGTDARVSEERCLRISLRRRLLLSFTNLAYQHAHETIKRALFRALHPPPLLSKSERLLAGTRGSMDVSSFPSFPFPTSGNTCLEKGLHGSQTKPPANLQSNETGKHTFVSNTRGTAAIAHWDVPDCGNTEFFINLKANSHLDEAYGGYCVFVSHPRTCISLCVCACVHTDNTSTHTCTHTHMEVLELRVNDNATCLG